MGDGSGLLEQEMENHILACLSESPANAKTIRKAAHMAESFQGVLTVLFVKTESSQMFSEEEQESLRNNFRLAEDLGAQIVTVYGGSIPEQIAEYVKLSGISKVVLGRSPKKQGLWHSRNLTEQIMGLLPAVDFYVVSQEELPYKARSKHLPGKPVLILWDILKTILIFCGATGAGIWFSFNGFDEENIIMFYLLGVLLTSLSTNGLIYGLAASVGGVLIFNYLFTIPFYTFYFEDESYLITFLVMFTASFITSSLTMRIKKQAYEAVRKAHHTEILLETSQKFQQAEGMADICQEAACQIYRLLERTALVYPIQGDTLGNPLVASDPGTDMTDYLLPQERQTAYWVWQHNQPAGAGTETFRDKKCMYFPIWSHNTVFAVAAAAMDQKPNIEQLYEKSLFIAMLNECALVLEKEAVNESKKKISLQAQQEQLRANLLRAISHDLRTPLTSISGNAGILIDNGAALDEQKKMCLYIDIYEDSIWLIQLVENLLSVTRIENGSIDLHMEAELIEEIIQEALRYLERRSSEHPIHVEMSDDLLMAKMDSRLIIQVLINLVDNALKYTPTGAPISVSAKREGEWVVIQIADEGPGISDEHKSHIFEMFYTIGNRSGDNRRSLGLGLSLCQSIINAHGGIIYISDNIPHGTIFTFTLPAEEGTIL